mmetsp:Transcript_31815/g.63048  ORF Transcript_31815/g.63048 Transcript_31815/m.63048 type:complete len:215 (+) Transcript_31815:159-803(+)
MNLCFKIITEIFGYSFIVLASLCFASGLYLAAEFAEENISFCRRWLRRILAFVIILHVVVWVDGSVPLTYTLIGIACNTLYIPLFDTFPFVEIPSIKSVLPFIATLASHVVWIKFFNELGRHHLRDLSLRSFAGFYLIFVWTVPLSFFISVIPSDEALPTSFGQPGASAVNQNPRVSSGLAESVKKGGVFKRFVGFFVKKECSKKLKRLDPYDF